MFSTNKLEDHLIQSIFGNEESSVLSIKPIGGFYNSSNVHEVKCGELNVAIPYALIALVPSKPEKQMKEVSKPFNSIRFMMISCKSTAFLDLVSLTIPKNLSWGLFCCYIDEANKYDHL